jgi:MoaA/NifB/PqqE/SkfB family radical SAM enzyme
MKTSDQYEFCVFKIPENGGRLIWEITNRCNYSCKYCIFSSGKAPIEEELSTAQVFAALLEMWEF